uniref:Uncharacterized protein n=1 Tax=Timema genevievae TaxID=629358 RepID=A0A7R9PKU5_TIMGE|nr:unnamed protein product [Timema genevievae]
MNMIGLGKLELSSCVLVLLAAILCYYLSDWFRAVLVVSRLPLILKYLVQDPNRTLELPFGECYSDDWLGKVGAILAVCWYFWLPYCATICRTGSELFSWCLGCPVHQGSRFWDTPCYSLITRGYCILEPMHTKNTALSLKYGSQSFLQFWLWPQSSFR